MIIDDFIVENIGGEHSEGVTQPEDVHGADTGSV